MTRFLLASLALLAAPGVPSAEVPAPSMSKAPLPANPLAAVPPTTYRSAFGSYRAPQDDALISWREANDQVARIGGWRVYAREAQPATEPVRAPATAAPHKH